MAELSPPLLTVAADLPLLSPAVVDRVLDAQEGEQSLTVVVPRTLKEHLGVSIDTEAASVPTGCNVVGATDEEESYCSYDARLAVNVNTVADAATAADLAVSERTTDDD
jgi:adenosylcobinamide-phosphate guanylyltransferase